MPINPDSPPVHTSYTGWVVLILVLFALAVAVIQVVKDRQRKKYEQIFRNAGLEMPEDEEPEFRLDTK